MRLATVILFVDFVDLHISVVSLSENIDKIARPLINSVSLLNYDTSMKIWESKGNVCVYADLSMYLSLQCKLHREDNLKLIYLSFMHSLQEI